MNLFDFVGIDVSKVKFDVSLLINNKPTHSVFENNNKGHAKFLGYLKKHTKNAWVCMEATGHYSTLIADYLIKNKIKTSIVNPFQIKNFARASLTRNKNDNIDARVIAQFCANMKPREYTPTPEEQQEIKDLIKLLDMLKSQKTQLTNQQHSMLGKVGSKAIEKLIKKLEKDIDKIEKQIAQLIKNSRVLKEKLELLTSITGVGQLTAYRVIALMPDVNLFKTAKQFAAYIGITPKQNLSGAFVGKSTISRIGDSRLRKSLYMAALVAKNHNKGLQCFIKRLELNEKKPKTIICAVMRKLAHIIFGVLKNKTPFNANLACN